MRDCIEIINSELKELREAVCACNVYTVAIKSDKDNINIDLVPADDYDEVVKLYNSLIDDLKNRDIREYKYKLDRMPRRFFKY